MAGGWGGFGGGSSSGGGSWGNFGGGLPKPKSKKKKKHEKPNVGKRLLGGLAGDIKSLAGIPMGLASLGGAVGRDVAAAAHGDYSYRRSRRAGAAMGGGMWYNYSPLVHGDIGEFGHRFVEHPLAPILDVATVFTAGAGAAARVGIVSSRAANVTLKSSRLGREIEVGGQQGRYMNPAIRARKEMVDRALKKLPGDFSVFGEDARYARHARRRLARDRSLVNSAIFSALKAGERLSDPKQRAIAQKLVHEHIYDNLLAVAEESPVGLSKAQTKAYKRDYVMLGTKPRGVHPGAATWGPNRWAAELDHGAIQKRFVVKNPKYAATGANAQPLFVPRRLFETYTKEAAGSGLFSSRLYQVPVTVWRTAVLGVPRYMVNNAVGNTFMAMVNDPAALRGWYEATKFVRGQRTADAMLKNTPRATWMKKHHGDVIGHAFAEHVPGTKFARHHGKVGFLTPGGWFDFVGKWTEEPFRAAMLARAVRTHPEFKALREATPGVAEDVIVDAMYARNPQLRHHISEEVDNVFGNYRAMRRSEHAVRDVIPFYAWNKAITRSTKNTVLDRPGRALALYYTGQHGIEETQKQLEDLPGWLKGAIPLGDKVPFAGETKPGRKWVLTTSGMNPYGTIDELGQAAIAVAGGPGRPGETAGGLLGPIAATGVEALTGTRMLTGEPHGMTPPALLRENFGLSWERPGLPQLRIIKEAMNPAPDKTTGSTGRTYEKLYDPSVMLEWANAFGLPLKSLSKKNARHRAEQEESF